MPRISTSSSLAIVLLSASAAGGCTIDGYVILAGPDHDDGFGEGETDAGETQGQPIPDLPDEPQPFPTPSCSLGPEALDGPLPCELGAPSDTLAPVTAWTWTGPGGEDSVLTTPLVANLSDDNEDGFVDVCDVPDVVVAAVDLPPAKSDPWPAGHLHIVDGGSGATSRIVPTVIDAAINPALGDLDGDGVAEIVALQAQGPNSPYDISERRLMAFRASGELLWAGTHWQASRGGGALAIADLDADGSPEILAPEYVADADGELLWGLEDPPPAYSMPVAADLDDDGRLEVLFGGSAYTHDGTWLFDTPTVPKNRGSVAVANFDPDPSPELYVQYGGAHGVFEHDGSFKAECPTGTVEIAGVGGYPVAVQDLDGDAQAELLFGYQDRFYVLAIEAGDCVVKWSDKTDASTGLSSGTLFDLLGDGTPEAIYADRSRVRIFDGDGDLQFQMLHSARESIANPVVADLDGDGAAEVLIVSSEPVADGGDITPTPTLIVLENADDHFAPTRRVWNQHTYHRSNVSELGRLPISEPPHWAEDDGFRVNSPASPGEQCIPPWLAP
jgi:hypothetical protein